MDEEYKIERLRKVEGKIKSCKKCKLWKSRKNPVAGDGCINSKIMFVGEAPGYQEDLKGKPFVGRAGKFLDELLASVGIRREDVYITNMVKCRPPGNRAPRKDEVEACSEYLDEQIDIIDPEIIVPLGNTATRYIMRKFGIEMQSIGKLHGKIFGGEKLIIPMYHPASAIYNPVLRDVMFGDFLCLKGLYSRKGMK